MNDKPYRQLADFKNAHPGKWAYVFGKGPSLDLFDAPPNGDVRICINESCLVVDSPDYAFTHHHDIAEKMAGSAAILFLHRTNTPVPESIDRTRVVVYEKAQCGLENSPNRRLTDLAMRVLSRTRDQIASGGVLYGTSGTVHSALHFAWLCGIVGVRLVGFDPQVRGYAESVMPQCSCTAGGPAGLQIIYDDIYTEAEALGLCIVNEGERLLKQKAGD